MAGNGRHLSLPRAQRTHSDHSQESDRLLSEKKQKGKKNDEKSEGKSEGNCWSSCRRKRSSGHVQSRDENFSINAHGTNKTISSLAIPPSEERSSDRNSARVTTERPSFFSAGSHDWRRESSSADSEGTESMRSSVGVASHEEREFESDEGSVCSIAEESAESSRRQSVWRGYAVPAETKKVNRKKKLCLVIDKGAHFEKSILGASRREYFLRLSKEGSILKPGLATNVCFVGDFDESKFSSTAERVKREFGQHIVVTKFTTEDFIRALVKNTGIREGTLVDIGESRTLVLSFKSSKSGLEIHHKQESSDCRAHFVHEKARDIIHQNRESKAWDNSTVERAVGAYLDKAATCVKLSCHDSNHTVDIAFEDRGGVQRVLDVDVHNRSTAVDELFGERSLQGHLADTIMTAEKKRGVYSRHIVAIGAATNLRCFGKRLKEELMDIPSLKGIPLNVYTHSHGAFARANAAFWKTKKDAGKRIKVTRSLPFFRYSKV